MHNPTSSLWWRDSNQTASGKPGAVQSAAEAEFFVDCPRLGFKPSSSRRNCFSTKENRGMLNSLESWTPPSGEKGP